MESMRRAFAKATITRRAPGSVFVSLRNTPHALSLFVFRHNIGRAAVGRGAFDRVHASTNAIHGGQRKSAYRDRRCDRVPRDYAIALLRAALARVSSPH